MKSSQISVLIIILSLLFACNQQREKPAYNIILITIDTLRADHLHCYGYKYKTSPHIDKLAENSFLFSHAYCPIPKTAASFASMMTGLHPFIHKTRPNRDYLKEKFVTLAEALQKKGYHTSAIVDNPNLSSKFYFNQGFNEYIEVWNHIEEKPESTPFITEKIISFLKKKRKEPFFLWANYIEPHTPYMPPEKFIEPRPDGDDIKKKKFKIIAGMRKTISSISNEGYYIALYDGAVKYIDSEIGKIIALYNNLGYNNNTIFIISSDHGEDLGDYNLYFNHGPLTFHSAIRVPLIIHLPGSKMTSLNYPVSTMDIYPTLMETVGIELPYSIQGINLFEKKDARHLLIYGLGTFAVINNSFHFVKVSRKLSRKLNLKRDNLFNIYEDPFEKKNIFSKHIVIPKKLKKQFVIFFNKHGYLKDNEENNKDVLSEKEIDILKTLGYIK